MKITYEFADGTISTIEVDEELGAFITASRRAENSCDRKQRYHCYSLDHIDYEGMEYAEKQSLEDKLEDKESEERVQAFLKTLPEVQKRRAEMLLDGMSAREIALSEGVGHTAINDSIKLIRKKYQTFFGK
jgi:DNA-directed RNA polymerase specialized sigma24 family protein